MTAVIARNSVAARPLQLTPRERQVLFLLYVGFSNKLIARELGISVSTVKIHISNIFAELNVSSRLQAVVVARRCGLIEENAVNDYAERVSPNGSSPFRLSTFDPMLAGAPLRSATN